MSAGEKLSRADNGDWLFWCPGCRMGHHFDARWTFNADRELPTFTPSLVTKIGEDRACHLFLREGVLQFLNDCWHDLAGKHVPLEPWPDDA